MKIEKQNFVDEGSFVLTLQTRDKVAHAALKSDALTQVESLMSECRNKVAEVIKNASNQR